MLYLRRHNVALLGSGFQHAANRGVVPLGTAAGKNDLHRIGRADQCRDVLSRLTDGLRHLTPEAMNARGVAIKLREIRSHRLEDFGQDPSRRVVIKVNFRTHRKSLAFFAKAATRSYSSYPTLPSRLTPRSFWASTANSIGSSRNTCLQKPLTIIFTASSGEMPRCRQ